MDSPFDVVVVGGGLTGASCALALDRAGLAVALVEGGEPAPTNGRVDADWDSRIYAISPGSAAFLAELGVWSRLAPTRLAPVSAMHIRGDDGISELRFSAYEAGVAQLAWIVESGHLQHALWDALAQGGRVARLCPAQVTGLTLAPKEARLFLQDGRELSARLVVGADGARSRIRALAQLPFRDKDYHQLGVVANFACARPHGGIARQWFREDGILAWLPLPGNRISMVWSTPTQHGEALLGLPPDELAARVEQAGAGVLGRLEVITPAVGFPLHLIQVDRISASRVTLIGDAAHQVHPLAGQGVNLGFGDAQCLAQVLASHGARDCGDFLLLRRYERARKEDVIAMQAVTDGLKALFGHPNPLLGVLRNLGLSLTGRLGPIKQLLVRHALGGAG
ncbi:UbiH/UbiF family hydroxylase [Thiobacter aerophilum]|uniref:UbiH/UbiF family hydroxylase n=1 Tax=Thiobacter aerophilum TaxID=3121275 RepID=A0ABV0EF48_9BURK